MICRDNIRPTSNASIEHNTIAITIKRQRESRATPVCLDPKLAKRELAFEPAPLAFFDGSFDEILAVFLTAALVDVLADFLAGGFFDGLNGFNCAPL